MSSCSCFKATARLKAARLVPPRNTEKHRVTVGRCGPFGGRGVPANGAKLAFATNGAFLRNEVSLRTRRTGMMRENRDDAGDDAGDAKRSEVVETEVDHMV